jgi:hypothetical protein
LRVRPGTIVLREQYEPRANGAQSAKDFEVFRRTATSRNNFRRAVGLE